jgi:hypothetical protein
LRIVVFVCFRRFFLLGVDSQDDKTVIYAKYISVVYTMSAEHAIKVFGETDQQVAGANGAIKMNPVMRGGKRNKKNGKSNKNKKSKNNKMTRGGKNVRKNKTMRGGK